MIAHLTLSAPPPSVNAMWRATVRGKVAVNILSKEGRDWKEAAERELKGQTGLPGKLVMKGGEAVFVPNPSYWRADILIPSSKTKCDLDNLLKGILDALGAAGKTPDDRYLVDLRIRFHGGSSVKIAVKTENVDVWATIKNASAQLRKKLSNV